MTETRGNPLVLFDKRVFMCKAVWRGNDIGKKRKKYSIKTKVFVILLIFQLPLTFMILFFNYRFIKFFNSHIASNNENVLSLYCLEIEDPLERLNESMLNFVVYNDNFRKLTVSSDPLEAHLLTYTIMKDYQTVIAENKSLYACYIIDEDNQMFREVFADRDTDYTIKNNLNNYIAKLVKEEKNKEQKEWQPAVIGGHTFLYMIKGYQGTYSVYIIDTGNFNLPETKQETATGQIILFNDRLSLNTTVDLSGDQIDLYESARYYFSGEENKYMITERKISHADVYAAYVMKYEGFLGSLSVRQKISIFLTLIVLIMLFPVDYYVLKKIFFQPVDSLVEVMNEIRKGKLMKRADIQFSDIEFQEVNQTFNSMMSQIENLKIESYEKELSMKETQFEFFQLQIRPHFYINCLKSIYGLLEEHKEEEAGKSIVCLSKHLRYMFKDIVTNVPIKEELQYVRNYMELQALNMAYPPEYEIEVDERANDFIIPAISILSFVENAVKYGRTKKNDFRVGIFITYMELDEKYYLNIHISDNGEGFPEKMLKELNDNNHKAEESDTVGMLNVIRRFQLYYGEDRVLFAFSNMKGANIDIFINDVNRRN